MSDNKSLLKNFLLGIAAVCGIIVMCMVGLNLITHHNRYVEVPDFTGMSVESAAAVAHQTYINVDVTDSVNVEGLGRGEIYSQFPPAFSQVKRGRTIDLTINSVRLRSVKMPDLVGTSMRQAFSELKTRGLSVGKLIYRPDIATNVVLRQLYAGRDIFDGTAVPAGSPIDLVLGINYETNPTTSVPDVIGMDRQHAVNAIKENCLNLYDIEYDSSIRTRSDSVSAVVISQDPRPSVNPVSMGSQVAIRLTRKAD